MTEKSSRGPPPAPRSKPAVPRRPANTNMASNSQPPVPSRQADMSSNSQPPVPSRQAADMATNSQPPVPSRQAADMATNSHPPVPSRPVVSSRNGTDVHQRNDLPNNTGVVVRPSLPTTDQKGAVSIDLAKLDEASLPLCARVQCSYGSWSSGGIKIQAGDELMLHCIDDTRVVLATGPSGKHYQLPVFAKQLYEILPLDPMLDDKIYEGTASLVAAHPLPRAVRVLEGYCAGDEDDTKEPDDVIFIQDVEEKVLIGRVGGGDEAYYVRYRSMEDSAKYTTMIHPDVMPLSQVIKEELPLRVRTAYQEEDDSDTDYVRRDLMLRLESIITRKRILATRGKDGKAFAIPLGARISLERTTPSTWKNVQVLMKPIYDLVNASLCMDDVCKDMLPEEWRDTMQAIPRPLQKALDSWLESVEGKSRTAEIAQADTAELQRKLTQQNNELQVVTNQLKALQEGVNGGSIEHPAPPPRPPRSPPMNERREGVTTAMNRNNGGNSIRRRHSVAPSYGMKSGMRAPTDPVAEEEESGYDSVSHNARMSQAYSSLARTDLEKLLKKLLDEKVMEQQERMTEMNNLKRHYEVLQTELEQEKQDSFELRQLMESHKDRHDSYDLMKVSPVKTMPSKGRASLSLTNLSRHTSPLPPPVPSSPARPLPSTPGQLSRSLDALPRDTYDLPTTGSATPPTTRNGLRPPAYPLPGVPVSPSTSHAHTTGRGGRKHPRAEYAPPIIQPSPGGAPGLVNTFGKSPPNTGRMGQEGRAPTRRSSTSSFGPLPPTPACARPQQTTHGQGSESRSQTDAFKLGNKSSCLSRPAPPAPSSNTCYKDIPNSSFDSDQTDPLSYEDLMESPPPPPPPRIDPSNPLPPASQCATNVYSTPDRNINTYSKEEVALLLQSLDLGCCSERFLRESVDGGLLLSIDEDMMIKDLGMTSFQARKLTMKIDELTSG